MILCIVIVAEICPVLDANVASRPTFSASASSSCNAGLILTMGVNAHKIFRGSSPFVVLFLSLPS